MTVSQAVKLQQSFHSLETMDEASAVEKQSSIVIQCCVSAGDGNTEELVRCGSSCLELIKN